MNEIDALARAEAEAFAAIREDMHYFEPERYIALIERWREATAVIAFCEDHYYPGGSDRHMSKGSWLFVAMVDRGSPVDPLPALASPLSDPSLDFSDSPRFPAGPARPFPLLLGGGSRE
jgi:hypothetical protein